MQRAPQSAGPRLHLAATVSTQHQAATRCYNLRAKKRFHLLKFESRIKYVCEQIGHGRFHRTSVYQIGDVLRRKARSIQNWPAYIKRVVNVESAHEICKILVEARSLSISLPIPSKKKSECKYVCTYTCNTLYFPNPYERQACVYMYMDIIKTQKIHVII